MSLAGPCEQWLDGDADNTCALLLNMLIKTFLKKQPTSGSERKSIDSLYRKPDIGQVSDIH